MPHNSMTIWKQSNVFINKYKLIVYIGTSISVISAHVKFNTNIELHG